MKTVFKIPKLLVTVCLFTYLANVSIPAVKAQNNGASEPEIEMVQVNGYNLRVQTGGLESREADEPVVIFENGALAPLESWGTIISSVADFAPVIAYDRSTFGESEWDGEVGTPSHVTENLQALLHNLAVDPPFILVGWSWGGNLIHYHASQHNEDIAGLVFIDPPYNSTSSTMDVFKSLGSGEEGYNAFLGSLEGLINNLPESAQAEVIPIYTIYKNREDF